MRELIRELPLHYRASAPDAELQRVLSLLAAEAEASVDLTMAQLFPSTASGWGLELWERAFGISVEREKDEQFRRTRIISKIRGQGTTTLEMIRVVAAAFVNGDVEVIEHSGQYSFTVKFVSIIGVPPNIQDLTAAILEIKPAHLTFDYQYTYRTWGQLQAYTWGQLSGNTWADLREGQLP